MNCSCTELRSYLKTIIFSAAACFIIFSGAVNAQTLILSPIEESWKKQDIPGAYMSLEAPLILVYNEDYFQADSVKNGTAYMKLLLAVNLFADYTEYTETAAVDIDVCMQEIIDRLKDENPEIFSISSIDEISNNGIPGRLLRGKCGFFLEEFPSIDFNIALYFTHHKLWKAECYYLDCLTNRQVAERIIKSVNIDLGQKQTAGPNNGKTLIAPELVWTIKELAGTGITADIPFDVVKTNASITAQGVDTIISYSYSGDLNVEFEAIYVKFSVFQNIDAQRKMLITMNTLRQNLSAIGKVLDFTYKIEPAPIISAEWSKAAGSFMLNGDKVKFTFLLNFNGMETREVHCLYLSNLETADKIAERIINSVKITKQ